MKRFEPELIDIFVEKLRKITVKACSVPYKFGEYRLILWMKNLFSPQQKPFMLILTGKQAITPRLFFTELALKMCRPVLLLYDALFEDYVKLYTDEDLQELVKEVHGNYLLWLGKTYKLPSSTPTPDCIQYSLEFLLKRVRPVAFDLKKSLKSNHSISLPAIVQDNALYIPLKAVRRLTNTVGKHYGLTFYLYLEVLVYQMEYLSIEQVQDQAMLCIPKEKVPPAYWFLFEPSQAQVFAQKSKVGGNGHE